MRKLVVTAVVTNGHCTGLGNGRHRFHSTRNLKQISGCNQGKIKWTHTCKSCCLASMRGGRYPLGLSEKRKVERIFVWANISVHPPNKTMRNGLIGLTSINCLKVIEFCCQNKYCLFRPSHQPDTYYYAWWTELLS